MCLRDFVYHFYNRANLWIIRYSDTETMVLVGIAIGVRNYQPYKYCDN